MSDKVTAIERLEGLLSDKDAEIRTLEERVRVLERDQEWSVHEHHEADPRPDLPIPRLEISAFAGYEAPTEARAWATTIYEYRLVYQHLAEGVVFVPLGRTTREGSRGSRPVNPDGTFDLPYRDGAHILHDMEHMQLPAFALIEGEVIERLWERDQRRDGYPWQTGWKPGALERRK